MRGSQLYTALFFPSLEFFPTGFSLARYTVPNRPRAAIGGWTEVNRRKQRGFTSLFVSNFPDDCNSATIWQLFKAHGKIEDVYIPNKKDKSGANFGFVKFSSIRNEKAFEDTIPKIKCGEVILNPDLRKKPKVDDPPPHTRAGRIIPPYVPAPIAHVNRGAAHTGSKTFAAAVAGISSNQPRVIPLQPDEGLESWMKNNKTLVGEAIDMNCLRSLPAIVESGDLPPNTKVTYRGGLGIILSMGSVELARSFLSNSEAWKKWFANLRVGDIDATIEVRELNWDSADFSHESACVLTSSRIRINEVVVISAVGRAYKVGVCEEVVNWHPFLDTDKDDEEAHEESDQEMEDEDDDGISDTWDFDDREEGEFIPEQCQNAGSPIDAGNSMAGNTPVRIEESEGPQACAAVTTGRNLYINFV
ncbi:hypothetical protein LXL04_013520 [Taraxacum kok-saghyz]